MNDCKGIKSVVQAIDIREKPITGRMGLWLFDTPEAAFLFAHSLNVKEFKDVTIVKRMVYQ